MDLSVIIVNCNTKDLLRGCLLSVFPVRDRFQSEVIVVDNASSDSSVRMIQEEFPQVKLIANTENVGFARANNQALRQAKGRYVLLLNPDTTVPSGTIDRMVQFMEDTRDAGIAGCMQVYPNGEFQVTCHRDIGLQRELLVALGLTEILPKCIDYGTNPNDFPEPCRVNWIGGAFFLIRRTVLEHIGWLDEAIFMYAEDADFCFRARQAGFGVYYVPDVQVIHYRGQSTAGNAQNPLYSLAWLQRFRSKRYLIRKHYGQLHDILYRGVVAIHSLRKLMQCAAVYLSRPKERSHVVSVGRVFMAILKADLRNEL